MPSLLIKAVFYGILVSLVKSQQGEFLEHFMSLERPLYLWSVQDVINNTERFYMKLCGSCKQGPHGNGFGGAQCPTCNCDNDCAKYGDCCDPKDKNDSKVEFTCITYEEISYIPSNMFMKTKCAENFTDTAVIERCNQSVSCPSAPVSNSQGITYRNQFCALCNYENNFTSWEIAFPIFGSDVFENIRDVFKCELSIIVDFKSLPYGFYQTRRECDILKDPIDKCNVTGDWFYHNQELEDLCQTNYALKPVIHSGMVFKNIFCFFCNGYVFSMEYPGQQPGDLIDIVKFDFVIKNQDPLLNPIITTSHNTSLFQDPFQNKSMEIRCNEGFILTDGECQVEASLHQLFIGVSLNTDKLNVTYSDNQILENVKFKLKDFQNYVVVITQAKHHVIDIKAFFVLSANEINVLEEAKSKLYFDWLIGYDVVTPELNYQWKGSGEYVGYDTVYYVPDDVKCRCLNKDSMNLTSEEFILFTNQFDCSYVEYDAQDFQNGSEYSKQLGEVSISYDEYTVYGDKIRICVDVIREKYSALNKLAFSAITNYALSIWFIICLAISVVCLLFTFITYCIFSSLRTLPCKNNMILIVFLILGQLLLFFSEKVTKGTTSCVCYGIAIHYAWLCVIFWMNICSFHMYRVFRSSTTFSSSHTDHWKVLLKYAIYGNGLPIIIITATILSKYFTSGSLGYGEFQCYLDTPVLVIISLVTPLSVTITCNIVFLSLTIWSIAKTSNMARQVGKDRHHIIVYIKLSTLTGSFWILSILSNFYKIEILKYLAILLNYGQGIFIFLSYVANRRVINLWLGLWGKSLPPSSSSASSSYQTTKTT